LAPPIYEACVIHGADRYSKVAISFSRGNRDIGKSSLGSPSSALDKKPPRKTFTGRPSEWGEPSLMILLCKIDSQQGMGNRFFFIGRLCRVYRAERWTKNTY
ncbi:hypothetical protein CBL_21361, partial [Carabus blaptoides fortunei]